MSDSKTNTITGTSGNDTINGTSGNDVIVGKSGNDVIDSGAGNDVITAGNGDDILNGGAGADIINAGAGDDTLIWDYAQNATTTTYKSYDQYHGGSGNNTLVIYISPSQLANLHLTQQQLMDYFNNANNHHIGGNVDFRPLGLNLVVNQIQHLQILDHGSFVNTSGNDTFIGETGVTNSIDYTAVNTSVSVSLATGTASGTGVGTDTFSNIQVINTGTGNDTLAIGTATLANDTGITVNLNGGQNTLDASSLTGTTQFVLGSGTLSDNTGTMTVTSAQNIFLGSGSSNTIVANSASTGNYVVDLGSGSNQVLLMQANADASIVATGGSNVTIQYNEIPNTTYTFNLEQGLYASDDATAIEYGLIAALISINVISASTFLTALSPLINGVAKTTIMDTQADGALNMSALTSDLNMTLDSQGKIYTQTVDATKGVVTSGFADIQAADGKNNTLTVSSTDLSGIATSLSIDLGIAGADKTNTFDTSALNSKTTLTLDSQGVKVNDGMGNLTVSGATKIDTGAQDDTVTFGDAGLASSKGAIIDLHEGDNKVDASTVSKNSTFTLGKGTLTTNTDALQIKNVHDIKLGSGENKVISDDTSIGNFKVDLGTGSNQVIQVLANGNNNIEVTGGSNVSIHFDENPNTNYNFNLATGSYHTDDATAIEYGLIAALISINAVSASTFLAALSPLINGVAKTTIMDTQADGALNMSALTSDLNMTLDSQGKLYTQTVDATKGVVTSGFADIQAADGKNNTLTVSSTDLSGITTPLSIDLGIAGADKTNTFDTSALNSKTTLTLDSQGVKVNDGMGNLTVSGATKIDTGAQDDTVTFGDAGLASNKGAIIDLHAGDNKVDASTVSKASTFTLGKGTLSTNTDALQIKNVHDIKLGSGENKVISDDTSIGNFKVDLGTGSNQVIQVLANGNNNIEVTGGSNVSILFDENPNTNYNFNLATGSYHTDDATAIEYGLIAALIGIHTAGAVVSLLGDLSPYLIPGAASSRIEDTNFDGKLIMDGLQTGVNMSLDSMGNLMTAANDYSGALLSSGFKEISTGDGKENNLTFATPTLANVGSGLEFKLGNTVSGYANTVDASSLTSDTVLTFDTQGTALINDDSNSITVKDGDVFGLGSGQNKLVMNVDNLAQVSNTDIHLGTNQSNSLDMWALTSGVTFDLNLGVFSDNTGFVKVEGEHNLLLTKGNDTAIFSAPDLTDVNGFNINLGGQGGDILDASYLQGNTIYHFDYQALSDGQHSVTVSSQAPPPNIFTGVAPDAPAWIYFGPGDDTLVEGLPNSHQMHIVNGGGGSNTVDLSQLNDGGGAIVDLVNHTALIPTSLFQFTGIYRTDIVDNFQNINGSHYDDHFHLSINSQSTLSGNDGGDTFAFSNVHGSAPAGSAYNIITDFGVGSNGQNDVIDLDPGAIVGFSSTPIISNGQPSTDILVSYSGDVSHIILQGFQDSGMLSITVDSNSGHTLITPLIPS